MIEWLSNSATNFATSAVSIALIVLAVLKTAPGARLFESLLKNYFDRRLSELKFAQDKQLALIKVENDAKIENVKSVNNIEIEKLKSSLFISGDRGRTSNDREYKATITVWETFVEAYQNCWGIVAKLTSYPDLSIMNEEELNIFVESIDTSPQNRKYILASSDKNKALSRVYRSIDLALAKNSIVHCRESLRKLSIFIPPIIEQKFESSLKFFQMVWAEQSVNFDSPGALKMDATTKFLSGEAEKVFSDIRGTIRERLLHPAEQDRIAKN